MPGLPSYRHLAVRMIKAQGVHVSWLSAPGSLADSVPKRTVATTTASQAWPSAALATDSYGTGRYPRIVASNPQWTSPLALSPKSPAIINPTPTQDATGTGRSRPIGGWLCTENRLDLFFCNEFCIGLNGRAAPLPCAAS